MAQLISAWASVYLVRFFFSSRRRHTRCLSDWSSDVCSSDLPRRQARAREAPRRRPGALASLPRLRRRPPLELLMKIDVPGGHINAVIEGDGPLDRKSVV